MQFAPALGGLCRCLKPRPSRLPVNLLSFCTVGVGAHSSFSTGSRRDVKRARAGERRMKDAQQAQLEPPSSCTARALKKHSRFETFSRMADRVKGFFELGLLPLLLRLDQGQAELGVIGDVCEIGVYHGKSFLPLVCLREDGEGAVVVDCFDQQQFNQDDSGVGSQSVCEANLTRLLQESEDMNSDNRSWLRVICADSHTITPQQLLDGGCGAIRLFSIDGCHTAEATVTDLQLAQRTLTAGGVVILDDVFNPDWPGVLSGLMLHTNTSEDPLRPFLIGFNKVLLCDQAHHSRYLELLTPGSRKTGKLLGSHVAIYAAGWITTFYGNDSNKRLED